MKWLIFGYVFWLIETAWFGFNWQPCCGAEQICNYVAIAATLYGLIRLIFEAKK